MDMQKILTEAAAKVGPSGQEMQVAEYFAEQFRPLVDEVTVDNLFNVIAHKKGTGPRVALFAHMDEISLMVTAIEDDGSLRLGNVGGVDPRILPASRVWVHGKEKLFGTIGALPPHLMSAADRANNYTLDNLHVDIGMSAERAKELVRIGDLVTFDGVPRELLNGQFASKTLDDRSCVAILLRAAEMLQKLVCDADVYFVCSSQEEVGGRGAMTSAFAIDPDLSVVLDVDFAETPTCPPRSALPIDAMIVTHDPFVQPKLNQRLIDCAKKHHVKLNANVASRSTGTDADEIGLSRAGVPSVLLSLPVKYMHTTVELLDMDTLSECGRLLALFLAGIDEKWEDGLWN